MNVDTSHSIPDDSRPENGDPQQALGRWLDVVEIRTISRMPDLTTLVRRPNVQTPPPAHQYASVEVPESSVPIAPVVDDAVKVDQVRNSPEISGAGFQPASEESGGLKTCPTELNSGQFLSDVNQEIHRQQVAMDRSYSEQFVDRLEGLIEPAVASNQVPASNFDQGQTAPTTPVVPAALAWKSWLMELRDGWRQLISVDRHAAWKPTCGVAATLLVSVFVWRAMQPQSMPDITASAQQIAANGERLLSGSQSTGHRTGAVDVDVDVASSSSDTFSSDMSGSDRINDVNPLAERVYGVPTLAAASGTTDSISPAPSVAPSSNAQAGVAQPDVARDEVAGPMLGAPNGTRPIQTQNLASSSVRSESLDPYAPVGGPGAVVRSGESSLNAMRAETSTESFAPDRRSGDWPKTYLDAPTVGSQSVPDSAEATGHDFATNGRGTAPIQGDHQSSGAPRYAGTDPATYEYLSGSVSDLRLKLRQQQEAIASRSTQSEANTADLRDSTSSPRLTSPSAPQGVAR